MERPQFYRFLMSEKLEYLRLGEKKNWKIFFKRFLQNLGNFRWASRFLMAKQKEKNCAKKLIIHWKAHTNKHWRIGKKRQMLLWSFIQIHICNLGFFFVDFMQIFGIFSCISSDFSQKNLLNHFWIESCARWFPVWIFGWSTLCLEYDVRPVRFTQFATVFQ